MNFLHQEFDVGPDDVIAVDIDHAANVLLLDPTNFRDYQAGRSYRYHGGHATTSPVYLRPPYEGRWHVVVDLGGMAGRVRAAIRIMPRLASHTSY